MLSQDALARLQEAAIFWSIGSGTPADVIEAACDCLVAGADSPTLRILAGISPARGSERDELRRWLRVALTELSLTYYPAGSREGKKEHSTDYLDAVYEVQRYTGTVAVDVDTKVIAEARRLLSDTATASAGRPQPARAGPPRAAGTSVQSPAGATRIITDPHVSVCS